MLRAGTVAALGFLSAWALGCGGGGPSGAGAAGAGGDGSPADGAAGAGGAACPTDFTPCGGDLLGTWRTDPRCEATQVSQPPGGGCPGESFDLTGVASQATWTFEANLTFTLALGAAGAAKVTAPAACLVSTASAPLACTAAEAGAMYAGRIAIVGGKPGAPTCASAADGTCACTIPFVAMPISGGGTYSKSGTVVTIDLGSGGEPVDYCATPSSLRLRSHGMDDAPGTGDYVRP